MIHYFKNKLKLFSKKNREELYFLYTSLLGFQPKNIDLYKQALTHKSAQIKTDKGACINNERLEFLGDAVLGAIISDILFDKYQKASEGFLTNTRSKIVQRESLNDVAVKIGFEKLMNFSQNAGIMKNNVYGNAFEALIGAIYLDQGYDKCKGFIQTQVLDKIVDVENIAKKEHNFKSRLIEWSQKHKIEIRFELVEEYVNQENKPIFQTQVLVNDCLAGIGTGSSKKESQQMASKLAMKKIKIEPKFWENTSLEEIAPEYEL